MARKVSTKSDSGSSIPATIGFEAKSCSFVSRHSDFVISSARPGQLFYSTQIPICLRFLAKNKAADAKRGFRDRRKQTLFIDARRLGSLNRADMGNPSLN